MKNRLTIFTPTYNRAYILGNLYKSLCRQSCLDFVWLIVDDGSTDNTEELVDSWKAKNKLKIVYIKQSNRGKQIAFNTGVFACTTDYFFCVDSDDSLPSDSVSYLYSQFDTLDNPSLAGLVALKSSDNKNPIGTNLPSGVEQSTLIDLYEKYGFKGDTALIYKTAILMQYPFEVAEGEKFMSENFVYYRIDKKYRMLLRNRIIYIGDYLNDGYTKNTNKLFKNNPVSYMKYKKMCASYSKRLPFKIKHIAGYIAMGIAVKKKGLIRSSGMPFLAFVSYPLGVLIYFMRFCK